MTDYTPTTEVIKALVVFAACQSDESRGEGEAGEIFDCWLADVIRKAEARAWEAGYADGCEDMENGGNATSNPSTEGS